MIGRLKGVVAEKGPEGVLLDVGGIGYEVHCPLTVIDRLPRRGQETTLAIHTHVREDQITLFGFGDTEERGLFRQLIGVSGIGPKIGLACLSGMDAGSLSTAIASEDAKRLTTIPGLGKRTAERLILELKDKVGAVAMPAHSGGQMLNDLESALRNLGFKTKDVDSLMAELAPQAESMSFEELLREALKRMGPN
jgi:holliday junction DNA helicase RuvA